MVEKIETRNELNINTHTQTSNTHMIFTKMMTLATCMDKEMEETMYIWNDTGLLSALYSESKLLFKTQTIEPPKTISIRQSLFFAFSLPAQPNKKNFVVNTS